MQIDLTQDERRLILTALKYKPFKQIVQLPQTPYIVRKRYKEIISKLERDEGLSEEIRKTL